MQHLIQGMASLDKQDRIESTSLKTTSRNNQVEAEAARLLVRAVADSKMTEKFGKTPLLDHAETHEMKDVLMEES